MYLFRCKLSLELGYTEVARRILNTLLPSTSQNMKLPAFLHVMLQSLQPNEGYKRPFRAMGVEFDALHHLGREAIV